MESESTAPAPTEPPNLGILPTELIIQILTCPSLTMFDILHCAALNRTWRAIIFSQNRIRNLLFLPTIPATDTVAQHQHPFTTLPETKQSPPHLQTTLYIIKSRTHPLSCDFFDIYISYPCAPGSSINARTLHPFLCTRKYVNKISPSLPANYAQDVNAVLHWLHERRPSESIWLDMFAVQPPVLNLHVRIRNRTTGKRVKIAMQNERGVRIGDLVDEGAMDALPMFLEMECFPKDEEFLSR